LVSKGAPGSRLGAVAETAGPRFRERIITPTKHWKMTAEDIRNRARRSDYRRA
jgi:polyphosphate kinase 2 (PPK2 family)